MKKEFEVRSSDGVTTYAVEFSLESGKLRVHCGCPAGVLGKWCKHKMQLISGDVSSALGFGAADMDEVLDWIRDSEFPRLLDKMKLAEDEMQAAKTKMDNVKKALEKAAQKGVNL
ncbi:MAG: hypothetical protein HYU79_05065 [Nitrosomonadales bacterium]|nr:hypothetical protein [Nitrosomonadales bacterium]